MTTPHHVEGRLPRDTGLRLVELRGLEPLTPSMPWRCATSCATAPHDCSCGAPVVGTVGEFIGHPPSFTKSGCSQEFGADVPCRDPPPAGIFAQLGPVAVTQPADGLPGQVLVQVNQRSDDRSPRDTVRGDDGALPR